MMPNEKFIRAKAVEVLEHEGWVVWGPEKTHSFGSKDIFTVFDLACQRPGYYVTRYIQTTSQQHHADRRQKVVAYLDKHDLMFWCEVWSWNPRAEAFRCEVIDRGEQPWLWMAH
jgi:hypothetical protein